MGWRDCCLAQSGVGIRRLGVAALLIVLLGGAARGQSVGDVERARVHFDAGRSFFNLGRYADAAAQFQAGYELVPKPRFLLNLGHCFLKMAMHARAREAYERFLALVPPDDSDREEVRERLTEIERVLPPAAPVVEPAPVAKPEPPTPAPPPPRLDAPLLLVAPAPRPPVSLALRRFKTWGWTIPVGAALVSGLVVGIYFGTGCRVSTVDCLGVPQ
jgi:tetratricopeptide (TPR) repeat protein